METIIDEIRTEVLKQMKKNTSQSYANSGHVKTPEQALMMLGAILGNANLAVLESNMNNYYAALIELSTIAILALNLSKQNE